MSHPYAALPARAFWRSAVANADREAFAGLYRPKFSLTRDTRIATAGSCFAQHIGTHLRSAGCQVLDAEPAPAAMPDSVAKAFGYGQFSARYGNIYTAGQLLDLLREVRSGTVDPGCVWENAGRYHDAFRPTVEPGGLDSAAEVLLLRQHHLARVAQMLEQTDLLIFTLGLTETWVDRTTGRAFPVCPGIVAGAFDAARHVLLNQSHAQIMDNLAKCLDLLKSFNPGMTLLLTVSPVPLTATASGDHVLNATSWSKATLRAAAGECAAAHPAVDYMPAYELITHPAAQPPQGGHWYSPNLRQVSPAGVARVMRFFLAAHGLDGGALPPAPPGHRQCDDDSAADAQSCQEVLLDAFAPGAGPR